MRACWAATLLVLVQPSPASCATCRGTSVVPRVLVLTHRHLHKSPCARRPFAEISGSISFSPPVFPFPETVPNFVCHFKGSLHLWHADLGHSNLASAMPRLHLWHADLGHSNLASAMPRPDFCFSSLSQPEVRAAVSISICTL